MFQIIQQASARKWALTGMWCVIATVPQLAQAQLASAFSSTILSGWSAGLSTGSGYEDGLQLVNGVGIKAVSLGVGGSGNKLWRSRKNTIDGSVSGGLVRYPQLPVLDQKNYSFSAGLAHNFTRYTGAQLRGQLSSQFINTSLGVGGPGIQLGRLLQVRSRTVTGAFQTQIRRSIVASVNGSIQQVNGGTAGFGTGQFSSAGASVVGQLNRETTLGVAATFQFSQIVGIGANLPVVAATLAHRRRSGLHAQVSAGAAVGPGLDIPLISRLFGSGNVGFAGRWGEVTVEAQRSIGQQFGIDSTSLQQINGAGIVLSKSFTRSFTAGVGAGIGGFSGLEAGGVSSRLAGYTANGRYQLNRAMAFSVQGAIRQQTGAFNVDSKVVSASFTYGWSQSRRADPAPP